LIDDLPARIDALDEAQRALQSRRRDRAHGVNDPRLEAEAASLRTDMMRDACFALRNDRVALALLDRIEQRSTLHSLRRDLKELSLIHTIHAHSLTRVGASPIDQSIRAQRLIERIDLLLSVRETNAREESFALRLRNLAAHYLTFATSEIRSTAAFVFRDRPQALSRYRSAYYAAKRSRRTSIRVRRRREEPHHHARCQTLA
jgi:hypothetical protein